MLLDIAVCTGICVLVVFNTVPRGMDGIPDEGSKSRLVSVEADGAAFLPPAGPSLKLFGKFKAWLFAGFSPTKGKATFRFLVRPHRVAHSVVKQ